MGWEAIRPVFDERPTVIDSVGIVSRPFAISTCLFAIGTALGVVAYVPILGAEQVGDGFFNIQNPTWLAFVKRNLLVAITILSGAVLFGLPTLVTVTFNGILVGLIIGGAHAQGNGIVEISLLLLPHGVVEIPALLLVAGVALSVPRGLVAYLRGRREQILRYDELLAYVQIVLLSFVMIVVAGWIEANLTRYVYELWQGV